MGAGAKWQETKTLMCVGMGGGWGGVVVVHRQTNVGRKLQSDRKSHILGHKGLRMVGKGGLPCIQM